jgi:outer membrane receptor protein involved in Fe transport
LSSRCEIKSGRSRDVRRPGGSGLLAGTAVVSVLLIALSQDGLFAGTTGKISGRVVDQEKQPVPVATVTLVGLGLGAIADAEGRYNILNVPPDTYEIKVGRVGFDTLLVKDVVVSADQTTWLNVEIRESAIATGEVVISAEGLPVELNVTSSLATVNSEQIEALPVQELQDVVNLQAGVVNGHFRGGRIGEVEHQVDGVSVNDAFDNESTLRIDRSLLQQVQVISGTFDAEYGQAMSGVVNAVLKQGTPTFEWSAEVFGGGFFFPGNDDRRTEDEFEPGEIRNFQGTISGPLLPKTVYLLSARRYNFDDYVYATRMFRPTDKSDFENKIFHPTGDGEKVPLGFSHEWSGAAKITHTASSRTKVGYQAIFNQIDGRHTNWAYRLNPDGLSRQHTVAVAHGFDWTQTLSPATFFDVNLRHLYHEFEDLLYEDVFDPRYDDAGAPTGDVDYEMGAIVQGADFTRFYQKTNGFLVKSAFVSQMAPEHLVKLGGELRMPRVYFGNPGTLVFTTVDGRRTLVRHVDDPPDFPGIREYRPIIGAGFIQDQMEWTDLTLRAGLRVDYFDARSWIPGDLANPANSIAGAPTAPDVATTKKVSVSPRLGLAYPIHNRAAIHLAYGHFYQSPPIGEMFSNADYGVLSQLQSGGVEFGALGNPDLKPEKTVQYEIGYKHALTGELGIDVTTFYKDIRDLMGVEFISTYNDAEYARLTNVDFGDVVGITVAADHRRLGPVSLSLDYTWQEAMGNSSDPRETATRAEGGEDPRPRLVPFNWDQRHTFNMTATMGKPGVYSASGVVRVASGQPYTPVIEAGFGHGLEANSGRKPAGIVIDLRAERQLGDWAPNMSVFGRAFNVFDKQFFNGAVFPSTGSPYYSRFPEADEVALNDPTRFLAPRRIEVGIIMGSEGR